MVFNISNCYITTINLSSNIRIRKLKYLLYKDNNQKF